jgi:hypothetical protein
MQNLDHPACVIIPLAKYVGSLLSGFTTGMVDVNMSTITQKVNCFYSI